MNLAIVHYHLNRGGVTSVIRSHLRALDSTPGGPDRAAVIYGGRRADWPEDFERQLTAVQVRLCEVPELEYDRDDQLRTARLHEALCTALARLGFAAEQTILHVHNHSLGKNLSLPPAFRELSEQGFRLLLHIHDFAEDFRPANYVRQVRVLASADQGGLSAALYPQSPAIHYAALNGRDMKILHTAGVPQQRLHFLPNPVDPPAGLPTYAQAREKLQAVLGIPPDRRYALYPVRGIRRKNVGESVLWSAVLRESLSVGLTLPPLNESERGQYEAWKQLAAELELPCLFETGTSDLSFPQNLAAADVIMTTSVAEGFGLVFLESFLAGKPLAGRDLPEITADFRRAGIELPGCSPEVQVPITWIGRERFAQAFTAALRQVMTDYGREPGDAEAADSVAEIAAGETIDFAFLDPALQREVVRQVTEDEDKAAEVAQLNRTVADALLAAGDLQAGEAVSRRTADNAAAIRRSYSLQACGGRLVEIYNAMMASPAPAARETPASAETILRQMLSPTRFHPLRCLP